MIAVQQIKSFLSSRFASVFIIIVSIAARIIQKIHFTGVGGDKAYQLQATKNLLEGHGISIHEVVASDLSHASYTPLIKWPPGYSLLASPFYALDHNGFLWGSVWLDILFAALFVWLARKIILLFDLPVYLANIYSLVTGFLLLDFCSYGSTDLISIVFYQAAIYFSLKLAKSPGNNYTIAAFIGLLLFFSGLVRYLFIPVAFVIPLYFVASGLINRNKLFTRHGLSMLFSLVILTAGLLIFQQLSGGSATYVMETEKGFYPQHLLRVHPFLFASFANLELFLVQWEKFSGTGYLVIGNYVRYVHFAFLLVILGLFLQWLYRKRMIRPNLTEHYFYIGAFSSLATIGVLAFLSVSNALLIEPQINWTFLDEARYYAVPIFFTQQLLFILLGRYWGSVKKAGRLLLVSCFAILVLSTVHSVYYTIQRVAAGRAGFFFEKKEFASMDYSRQLLQKLIAENPGKNIVCSAATPMFNNFGAIWENIPGLYDYEKLNTLQLSATKETIVFVVVWDRDAYRLRKFLDNPGKQLIGSINDYRFYTLHVKPGSP
jgi:hypothetical protein